MVIMCFLCMGFRCWLAACSGFIIVASSRHLSRIYPDTPNIPSASVERTLLSSVTTIVHLSTQYIVTCNVTLRFRERSKYDRFILLRFVLRLNELYVLLDRCRSRLRCRRSRSFITRCLLRRFSRRSKSSSVSPSSLAVGPCSIFRRQRANESDNGTGRGASLPCDLRILVAGT